MVDINVYRCRIGKFSQHRSKKNKFMKFEYCQKTRAEKHGETALTALQCILKLILVFSLLQGIVVCQAAGAYPTPSLSSSGSRLTCWIVSTSAHLQVWSGGICSQTWESSTNPVLEYQTIGKKQSSNFLARYLHGNRSKGI